MTKEDKIRITFIIPTLHGGGAERVMSFIAENLDKNKFHSELLVIGSNLNESYKVQDIPLHFFNKESVKKGTPAIIRYLRNEDVDIIISAISHLNLAMSMISILFPRIKFVGRETIVRSGKKDYIEDYGKTSWFSKKLSRFPPNFLNAIICQSNDMKNDLVQNYNYPIEKLVVLNNPVTPGFSVKKSGKKNAVPQYVTVGRLEIQKGYERLITTMAKFNEPYHLTIIGSGSLEKTIKDLVYEHNLNDQFTHVPFTSDIQGHLAKSDVYLQSSYVEGFPNALLESCAVGVPVLAFNALGGINEIIQSGINGYIADDEADFLVKLKQMNETNWDPQIINHSVTSRYSEDIILSKYEEFLEGLMVE